MSVRKTKSRRGHGDGSIYRNSKTGKWEAVLDLGYLSDPNDSGKKKRKRIKRTCVTEREAIKALDDVKREHHLGTLQHGKSPRLADYLQEWFERQGSARWKPNSIRAHRKSVRYCVDALGHIRLDQLRAAHVEDMLNTMATTYARNTIVGALSVLRMALKDAVRDGLVVRNVASEARMPRHVATPMTQPKFMTTEELQPFLAAAAEHPDGAVCAVAVMTGLRLGEIRGLRWQDIDMDASILRVTHQLQSNDGGGWRLTTPKTDTSIRTLPLPAVTVAALKRQHRRQLEDRVLAGSRWQDHGFVFTAQQGQPMPEQRIRLALEAILASAGVDGLRFHDLRHTFASFLISNGCDLVGIKELMGHTSIQTTANRYAKLFPDKKQAVMATWDQLSSVAS